MADMRERLIEIIREAKKQYAKNVVFSHLEEITDMPTEEEYIAMCLEKEVILPPCKVGEKVYVIGSRYRYGREEKWINTGKFRLGDIDQIGKTVFLTKEEAQKVIEGRSRQDDFQN